MTSPAWTRYTEPFRATMLRTGAIALIAGTVMSVSTRGRVSWPVAVLVMLWPSLGGHYIEIWFLNWVRPRIPADRGVQLALRLATWFMGGVVLAALMSLTARMLAGRPVRALPWWVAGPGFIAIELIAHLGLRTRGRPSVYDGLG